MSIEDQIDRLLDRGASRRDFLRGSAVAGAGLLLPGVLAACSGSGSSSAETTGTDTTAATGTGTRGGRLVIGLHDGGADDTLSPWAIPTFNGAARAQQVYERLFTFGPSGAPVPRLAVSAEGNSSATVWQVKLRPDVQFHNGKTMDAQDVMYSLQYVVDPKNKAESSARASSIDFNASKIVSPTEIEFHLKRPVGDFQALLAEKALWIVPKGTKDFTKQAIGTGPFTSESFKPGVSALFKKYPDYWGLTATTGPYVDELEIQTLLDGSARVNALLAGQIQEMTNIDFVAAKAQATNAALRLVKTPQPNAGAIYMALESKQFRDNRVRQAMRLIPDRSAFVDNVALGFGSVGNDLFGKGQPSYDATIPQREHDPEKAKSLLKAAGYDGLSLTLPTSDAAPGMLATAALYRQQAAAAGVTITLKKIPADSHYGNQYYLKPAGFFYQTQWSQGFESMAQDGLLKGSPYNETQWYRSDWDTQFFKAQGIVDPAERNAAYRALQEPLWNEGGYIIPFVYLTLDAASPKVQGIVPNVSSGFQNLGGFEFKDHWLKS